MADRPTHSLSSSGILTRKLAHIGGRVVISPRSDAESTVSHRVKRHTIPSALVVPVDGNDHRIHGSATIFRDTSTPASGMSDCQSDVTNTGT